MPRNKTLNKKKKLISAIKKNRQIPVWYATKAILKTRQNSKKRNWRKKKLGL